MKKFYFQIKLIFLLLLPGYCLLSQDTCCINQGLFIELAQNVETFGELGDCQINFVATGLTDCMQITWDFGDGTVVGPFGDNTPVTHIYSGTNTYTVCHIIEEVNQNGVCWNYTECEDVLVLCDSCCNSYDLFCLNIMNGVSLTIDNNLCKATLIVEDIPSCNYLEYIDWGDASSLDFGPFTNGDMPMHTYTNSGSYIVSYLAIEEDPFDGSICFEKILYDTIVVECNPCCRDFDAFCDLIDLGWQLTVDEVNCLVTITTTQFDSCHWILTDGPDWHDGSSPPGGNYAANGSWSHTYNQAGTYVICALIAEGDGIDFCWEKYLCDTITINCGPCDTNALTASLTGYFPFDASANDESSLQIHGIVNGATLTSGYDAAPNSAYHFNGSTNAIFAGTHNRSVSDEVTVAAWVKTTEQVNGQWIAGKYSFNEDHGYHLTIGDSGGGAIGKVAFSGRDGSSSYHSSGFSSTRVNDGKWHCVVGTAVNGVWSVYVDGQLENSAAGGTNDLATSAREPFTIGRHTNPNFPLWMNGDIDEVMVFNRGLSAHEIRDCICGGFKPHYEYCACPSGDLNGPNLVTNGNFSLGDNFFTSIGSGNPCQCAAASYCVSDNFTDKCSTWQPVIGLPGGGNNNFLIIDGDPSSPATLWSQQVNVVPCMTYCFSFSTASVYPPNQQNFALDIVVYDGSGAPVLPYVGSNVTILQTNPAWSNHSFTWTAPCNVVGPFTIAINQITGSGFNDFGIDDICFTKTCACPAGSMPGQEFVLNGDFENGNTQFNSDYFPLTTCSPGLYTVDDANSVGLLCNNWSAVDHTSGSSTGKFFIADGSQTPGLAAWRQGPYSLDGGKSYSLCAWVNNLYDITYNADDPIVQAYLVPASNPTLPILITSTGAIPESPDIWINMSGVITVPTDQYLLEFRTASTAYDGNNFALDDISFMECSGPTVPDSCCDSFENFYQKIGSVDIILDNTLCKVTFDLSDLPPCDSIGWIDWGDGTSEIGNFGSGDMPMHTYSGSGFYFIQYSGIEYDLSVTPPVPCLEWVFVYTFHLDCSDCECHSDLVLTHGNTSYPVTCDPHIGFVPSFGCPIDTVSISGFFGCGDSITWDPCLETEVNWILTLDNAPVDAGVTSNYSTWIFPPALVANSGVYELTLTTICPGSIDTCLCIISWVQEPCDSCVCSGTSPLPNYVMNGNFGQGDNHINSGLTLGSVPGCFEGSYWVDQDFRNKCNQWPTFLGLPDGTLGTNNFLIIDGEEFDPGSTILWSQPVNIVPGDTYCFSLATRSGFQQQNFNLNVVVFDGGNNQLNPLVGQPSVSGAGWISQSFTWQAPAAVGPFTLAIIQQSSAAFRDFGIDNICFTESPPPDSCCSDYDLFCQNAMNAISVTVDNTLCKAILNIGNLPACDSIAWINWGQGPIVNGSFSAGDMAMHTYNGSGTYHISYLVEEYDYSVTPPRLCFEKLLIDTINLSCSNTMDTCYFNTCLLNNSTWVNLSNNHFIMDMIVFQGNLIVAGSFNIGGARNIAAWNGTSFIPLGTGPGAGTNGTITSLAVYDNKLYVGGGFSLAGNNPANNIAIWDGSNWNPVISSSVNGVNGAVRSLQTYGANLVTGGTFTSAGILSTNNIASWNASYSSWSPLGTGITGTLATVNGLGLYNNELVAGGIFTNAGGLPVSNIAKWDGISWSNLGNGITLFPTNMGQGVKAILQLGQELIVGGRFQQASNAPNTNFIARWNGVNWSSMSTGVNTSFEGIYDLKIYGGQIYAGGLFTSIGGNSISGVARWDGTNWNSTNHPDRLVHALECYFAPDASSDLYSAGEVFINRWVCTVGTNNTSIESLHIYPNPTNGNLTLELPTPANIGITFRVVNLAGQILLNTQAEIGSAIQNVSTNHLSDGMYFLQVVSDDRIVSINKFVKM